MADKKLITPEKALEIYGVEYKLKEMIPPGKSEPYEFRGALRMPGGMSSSLTVVVKSWIQSAHTHQHAFEITSVLRGQVVALDYVVDKMRAHAHKRGEVFFDRPWIRHALYVTAGTVLSTAKYTKDGFDGTDWHADPELDQILSAWSEERILKLAEITSAEFYAQP